MSPTHCVPSWTQLAALVPSASAEGPLTIDCVRDPGAALSLATSECKRPTLFRERQGWCPHSERLWLSLELKGIEYDTVQCDPTWQVPGARGAETTAPRLRWPSSECGEFPEGDSMALMRALDERYPETPQLWPHSSPVDETLSALAEVLPSEARSSTRAVFLFADDKSILPTPLPRSRFERALDELEALLEMGAGGGGSGGSGGARSGGARSEGSARAFFCGESVSAADVAIAPYLERWCAQLPCLHPGLMPRGGGEEGGGGGGVGTEPYWPRLSNWFAAMDSLPPYACRVKGDAASWRKVLSSSPWWPAGWAPPDISAEAAAAAARGFGVGGSGVGGGSGGGVSSAVWESYSLARPHIGATPALEASAALLRNRKALSADARRRRRLYVSVPFLGADVSDDEIDEALRAVAWLLAEGEAAAPARTVPLVPELAAYLDERVCVPRDMGAPAAAEIRKLHNELQLSTRGTAVECT